MNAGNRAKAFALPPLPKKWIWKELVNTAQSSRGAVKDDSLLIAPHALVLLSYERTGP
jgi:hypothetical protein